MAYLRCTKCGSKALVAASQCPRCAEPFHLLDGRGERVKLKRCRGCGIMHRIDATCHWCGDVPAPWRLSGALLRNAAAVALMVVGAGAAWRVAPAVRDFAATRVQRSEVAVTPVAMTTNPVAPAAGDDANARYAADSARIAASLTQTMDSAAAVVLTASDDSITWTPAVARTWVNVRSDASRTGEVVGVIQPSARAMLGTDRAGWRRVRSPDVSGWVDPRLFDADSLRTRGN